MKKSLLIWSLAVIVALLSAVYQRMTGPTYAIKLKAQVENYKLSGQLPRDGSSVSGKNLQLKIEPADTALTILLEYRKFNFEKNWTQKKLEISDEGIISAELPPMPPAGKLEYAFILKKDNKILFTQQNATVIRFKNDVPAWCLVPHIIFIFLFMIFSNAAAFRIFISKSIDYKDIFGALALIILGGFIFGPIVQKFAFGEYWAGIPFGYDLTDNKVLFALVFWLLAFFKRKSKNAKLWIIIASLSTLIIFLIPHSVLGSELDYNTMKIIQN